MIDKHSAGGVIIKDGQVLAISWTTHSYIAFPKGGIEVGETSEMAAIREVKEETGYNVAIVKPLGSWTYEFTQHDKDYRKTVDYFLMVLTDDLPPEPHREPGEHFENLWLSLDTAAAELTFGDAKEVLHIAVKEYRANA